MAKFWNFVFFQLGWFACILGAANQQVLLAVLLTLAYIAFHIWYLDEPWQSLHLLSRALVYGFVADSLLVQLGYLNFQDSWPTGHLSPVWMWVLWVLVATTINGSLSWLRGRPILGAILGGICGPMSYEAGIRMGAGSWGSGGQTVGLILVGVVWALAIPLFFYWDRTPIEHGLAGNP
ncbi:DUF2878 domain-containing protein [Polynucleobacter tropicus]|uniref:DUF2878 domain-containing protein n=1 Tax=Polynucleobacter tropicus TaxID=1743174 RepID=A0A6M9PZT3_9BURK|nr:DUF2878 domain-containing protein [Polynucleobacter tropicus]QKM65392.1 DUF2878 domain-containing protein [Polynucleobacter tropicus]